MTRETKRMRDYIDARSVIKKMCAVLVTMGCGRFQIWLDDRDLTLTQRGMELEVTSDAVEIVELSDVRVLVKCRTERERRVTAATAAEVCRILSELNAWHFFIVPPHALAVFRKEARNWEDELRVVEDDVTFEGRVVVIVPQKCSVRGCITG